MHVVFKSIRLTRFRSYIEETILHFDSAGPGLYFLKGENKTASDLGSNDSGKSTIIDALMWCLYGKTVQGLKNPDIIPWSGTGQTAVEVTILKDKIKHVITRTAAPNSLSIDGVEAGQDYVTSLIGIPFEIVPYSIILGQRKPLFFDLTPGEKLKLFTECLNLERWEERSRHAAEIVKSQELEILAKEAELNASTRALEAATEDLERVRGDSAAWEEKRSTAIAGKDRDKKKLQAQLKPLCAERDTADLKLEQTETELRALDLTKLRREESVVAVKLSKITLEAKNATTRMNELLLLIEETQTKVCPTCKQMLKDRHHIGKLVDNLEQQIEALKIEELNKFKAERQSEYDKIITALNANEVAEKRFVKESNDARDVLDRVLPQISTIESKLKALEEVSAEFENQDNPYAEQQRLLRQRIAKTKEAIAKDEESIRKKTENCERHRFWVKAFKDIKLYTLEEVLQEQEITTNIMVEDFGLSGWNVKYDVERETKSGTIAKGLNISVMSPKNKSPVKWECWGGGVGQRLRLIGSAALGSVLLNHAGVTTNLEVYDEPTESLSKEGVSDLVELLAQRAKDTNKNIWFIDHHVVSSQKFSKEVVVTKDKAGSHVRT